MSKETFTRDNLIDHLQRLAFHGVGAVVGVGDLVDRSDMKGGRTGWGDVVLRCARIRSFRCGAVQDLGRRHGMARLRCPGRSHRGVDVSYPVSTPEEARAAVRNYVRIKPDFIKIWVDDRAGRKPTLTPALYGAILDEAHKFNVPVASITSSKSTPRRWCAAAWKAWLHVPVRRGRDRGRRDGRPGEGSGLARSRSVTLLLRFHVVEVTDRNRLWPDRAFDHRMPAARNRIAPFAIGIEPGFDASDLLGRHLLERLAPISVRSLGE